MSRDIWVISDTHFGHENIIKYSNRPFKDVQEMDEAMIENWNSVVKDHDKVYHLGDLMMEKNYEKSMRIMKSLKGHKRIILGNHDDPKHPAIYKCFDKIGIWRIFKEHGLILSHIPIHPISLRDMTNVHGHIHTEPSPEGPYKCVCVEQINYTPVHIEELRVRS